ncbi:MAG TPA: YbaB/EbfC family nucleoid-associated protein [Terrimicrobiaceae bacterium]|nr:YbaB/EbfC family nucleoid-associated protein [Terrimicrobiaceae bacterium]
MNIQKMLQQAQRMQAKLAEKQSELSQKTVEASAGGGKVTVTANGAGDVLSIKIDPSVVDPEDVEMLEDLVLAGVKQAIEDGRKMAESEMKKVTGGMDISGMPF